MINESNNDMVPAFNFRVLFAGLIDFNDQDSSFESVSGIQAMVADDGLAHGQEKVNHTVIFQPVFLRRAVRPNAQSGLRRWVMANLHRPEQQILQEVKIEILNEAQLPVLVVLLKNVSVKSWSLGDLHAQKSSLLMEEISLAYRSVDVF